MRLTASGALGELHLVNDVKHSGVTQLAPESSTQNSVTFLFAKGFLVLLGAFGGYLVASLLRQVEALSDPINLVYLALVGLLIGLLVSTPLARRWENFWRNLARGIPPQAVLAAGVGATVALIITVLLNTLLESVPGFTWYWSLIITAVLVTASSWFFVTNRHFFAGMTTPGRMNATPVATGMTAPRDKVIDTSAIIDGRIAEVVDAQFVDGNLLIPRFILAELQNIADSSDPLRRGRGRRGLEVLDKLIQQSNIQTEVINDDFPGVEQVDDKLVRVCEARNAALITTDYNLNRVAALQNVRVLNVNQLANAVRPVFLPGERLSLHIVKEGREQGQGLAYLEDGTMVVVEDGGHLVGNTVDVTVTSHLQTNMGRMIFARPHQNN